MALVAAHFFADHRRRCSSSDENSNFLVFLVFPRTYEQRGRHKKQVGAPGRKKFELIGRHARLLDRIS
jgi:hypothetical protein